MVGGGEGESQRFSCASGNNLHNDLVILRTILQTRKQAQKRLEEICFMQSYVQVFKPGGCGLRWL